MTPITNWIWNRHLNSPKRDECGLNARDHAWTLDTNIRAISFKLPGTAIVMTGKGEEGKRVQSSASNQIKDSCSRFEV
jgi:hypothetical protein